MKNLLNSSSIFAAMIAASNPISKLLEKQKKTEEARVLAATKKGPRVFQQGTPRRPAHIPHHGPVTYRGPEATYGDPMKVKFGSGKRETIVEIRRALPREVARKMLYNKQRAANGRWCN